MGKCDLEGITAISERNKILPEIGDRKRSRTHYCHMWLPMDNDLFRTNPSLGKATPKRPDLLFGFGCEIQMNDVVHARACDVERPGSEAVKKLMAEIMDFTKRSRSLAGAAKIYDRTKRFDQAAPELLLATN